MKKRGWGRFALGASACGSRVSAKVKADPAGTVRPSGPRAWRSGVREGTSRWLGSLSPARPSRIALGRSQKREPVAGKSFARPALAHGARAFVEARASSGESFARPALAHGARAFVEARASGSQALRLTPKKKLSPRLGCGERA
ncbi:hypothetical protein LA76x_1458 [Lysobacter antibioticus]|uniref:Uncharacterized protein n=1 Tax=Lysobacter antibioticus TaxID=84531 RepID=A0A0S2F7T3_LYSAN|nr:hypothetical protein LA76x_1458 [Lysobacter antibioticus]